ncbi:MAG TPA: hypothetical protein DCP92_15310 [Nitrospiraceae bacterium]|nr:hypothetical protein [Nitrospiraceae bacterium]
MTGSYGSTKRKPIGKMVLTGIISIALYGTLISKQDVVVDYFSRGGVYAFLPIAVAFVFSFFHGNFTGHFWTVMGIEAAKKKKEVR